MTIEESFLQAIVENAEDDTPRLVFADWLEEHDDAARAEFIRIQCKSSKLPEATPRRVELETRERSLLLRHRKAWLGPLSHLGRKWEFHRGFVETGIIDAQTFLRQGGDMFGAAPIRRLTLRKAVGIMDRLAACDGLIRLRELDFQDNLIGDKGLRQLLASPYLATLTSLGLVGTDIGLEGVKALAQSACLERLAELDLGKNNLEGEAAQVLAFSPASQGLRHLSLHNNRLGVEGVEALTTSPHLSGLTGLSIGFNYGFGDAMAVSLAASPHLHHLKALYMSETDMTDRGLLAIARSRLAGTMVDVWLDGNRITARGVEAFATSPPPEGPTNLVLGNNEIGDEGLWALAKSPRADGLTLLFLHGNGIGDKGVQALAASPHFSRLGWLGLWKNKVTDAGARALADSPYLSTLTRLALSGNALSQQGNRALLKRFGRKVCRL